MFLMILIDILILLAVGVPIALLHRKWREWVDREPQNIWPFDGTRRFGLRSWAARSFVIDKPIAHVKELIDGFPEINYAEAAAMVSARGSAVSGSFMALAPLTGRQVFETGIETEWIAPDTVEIRARAYADWPVNALDSADLPAKQHQMTFEYALLHVKPHQENGTRVSYELQAPPWVYMLVAAIVLLVGWAAWMLWRALGPDSAVEKANFGLMAVLTAWLLTSTASVLRLQSVALMDSVVRTLGPLVRRDS